MVEQTLRTSETITHWALASNLQRTVSRTSMTRDSWLVASCPDYLLQATSDSYVGVCIRIVWCNAKGVGDREVLETYSNSASKNTSETDIFPHGPKSLLTSVIVADCLPWTGAIVSPAFCRNAVDLKCSPDLLCIFLRFPHATLNTRTLSTTHSSFMTLVAVSFGAV